MTSFSDKISDGSSISSVFGSSVGSSVGSQKRAHQQVRLCIRFFVLLVFDISISYQLNLVSPQAAQMAYEFPF